MNEPIPRFEPLRFSTAQIGAAIGRRGRHRNANDEGGHIMLVNRDHTLVIRRRGRELTLEPGEACLLSGSEPITFESPFFGRTSCIQIPNEILAQVASRLDERIARVIARQTPALALLVDYLDIVDRQPGHLPLPLLGLVQTHIHELVALVLGTPGERLPNAKGRSLNAARERAIKLDIATNMAQRDLSITAIAARHHVSPRSLQRIFEREDKTFTEHVLELRLSSVHRLLRDSQHAARSISELAFDCGFGDMSHFNHAFRRKFGASPTEIRSSIRVR
jgi:AraC-like DNA-binding protein